MPTEQQISDVCIAAINAQFSSTRAYESSSLPASRPAEFIVVTLVRRSGGSPRAGRYVTSGWALYVMAASQTFASNARNSLEKARAALEGVVITVDGVKSTPIRFGDGRPVAPDDGWLSGVNTYQFAL